MKQKMLTNLFSLSTVVLPMVVYFPVQVTRSQRGSGHMKSFAVDFEKDKESNFFCHNSSGAGKMADYQLEMVSVDNVTALKSLSPFSLSWCLSIFICRTWRRHTFSSWPVICMCGQAVEQSGALCQSNSALLLQPASQLRVLWWLHGKKQRLATDNISFTFSCELPALCEHAAEKCWREGIPFPPFFPFGAECSGVIHSSCSSARQKRGKTSSNWL